METKINKLSEIEKRNPFTVPEDYFSRLNEHIMNFLPEKEIIINAEEMSNDEEGINASIVSIKQTSPPLNVVVLSI